MTSTRRSTRRSAAVTSWSVVAASVLVACGSTHSGNPLAVPAPAVSTAPKPSPAVAPTSKATTTAASTTASTTASTNAAPTPAPTTSHARATGPHAITLAFGGDVHFEGVDAQRLAADPATALGPIASVLGSADLAMVNLETAVTTGGTRAVKQYNFRAPATAFTALKAAGVDVVTMANNHGEDYGQSGLADTLAAAKAADFPVVGIGADEDAAFAPYDVTIKGDRVAIIGATQVLDSGLAAAWTAGPGKPGLASAKDVPRLLEAVREARAKADTVVVYLHWGKELSACPIAAQTSIAQQLVDAGADIVVGSHAHVQLGAGRLGNAYIDYGLGNFVFYAGGNGVTARSGVLVLTVVGRSVTASRWVPAHIEGGVPVPLTGADAATGLDEWNGLRGCTGLTAIG